MLVYNLVLFHHFNELKLRFFYLILCFLITVLTAYHYCFEIVYIFTKPFLKYKKNFIFTDITEFFYTNIEVCIFFSFYLIIPVIVYHIWCFFINTVTVRNRQTIVMFSIASIISLYASILVVYFLLLPYLFEFLQDFMVTNNLLNIELQPRIKPYIYLAFKIFFFSSVFTMVPFIFLVLIYAISPLHDKKKKLLWFLPSISYNRHLIFGVLLILSSLFIPPDIMVQFCVSILLCILIEVLLLYTYIYINFIN
jgi:Tat protein translocase TatC